MPEIIKQVKPPSGVTRFLFRVPLWFYRRGFGWLLGDRFLELTHIGRKTGLPRHTVLEVVRHDRAAHEYIIAAGFGKQSDWYKNILVNPNVKVRSGREVFSAVARPLSVQEAGQELVQYSHNHPAAFQEILKVMGYRVSGTDEDTFELGQNVPLFLLKPADSANQQPFSSRDQ